MEATKLIHYIQMNMRFLFKICTNKQSFMYERHSDRVKAHVLHAIFFLKEHGDVLMYV